MPVRSRVAISGRSRSQTEPANNLVHWWPAGERLGGRSRQRWGMFRNRYRLMLVSVFAAASILSLCAQTKADNAAWSEQQKARMAARVRRDFQHAWKGYKRYAWG